MSKIEEYVTESSEHYFLSIVSQETKENLRARHAVKPREYHTWEHVRELFRLLEMVEERLECLPAVILAVAFHDSVYNPQRKDNELRSAQLMRRMTKGLDLFWVERADSIILATADHQLPPGFDRSSDAAYFLDMDRAVLGSPPERYQRYAAQVHAEYGHLTPEQWRAGRSQFLQSLLPAATANTMFYTDWARDVFGWQVVENLQWELDQLEENQGE